MHEAPVQTVSHQGGCKRLVQTLAQPLGRRSPGQASPARKSLLACAVLGALASSAAASPRVFLQPAADSNPANPRAGRVVAALDGGRYIRLSRTARCWNLKRSPDGKAWAWIEGEGHHLQRESQTVFPTRIVVWRNGESPGRRGTLLRPEKAYSVLFVWSGAERIAVGSQGRHGGTHLELFNARNGRRLQYVMDYQTPLPSWADAVARI